MSKAFSVRPHAPADLSFIFDNWLKSYWDGINRKPWPVTFGARGKVGLISTLFDRNTFYNSGQRVLIAECIGTAGCVVAHKKDDPDELFGFACGVGNILHYVYTKEYCRRMGIGAFLAASVLSLDAGKKITATHMTGKLGHLRKHFTYDFEPDLWRISQAKGKAA